jgi:hypothetical protein
MIIAFGGFFVDLAGVPFFLNDVQYLLYNGNIII